MLNDADWHWVLLLGVVTETVWVKGELSENDSKWSRMVQTSPVACNGKLNQLSEVN